jgi:tetratricopeptide (TPR) repeat protein
MLVLLCFVGGIGGGVLLRSQRAPIDATNPAGARRSPADRAERSAEPLAKAQGEPETKPKIPRDPIARKAAEELFGQHFRAGYQNFQAERYSQAVQDFQRATEVAPYLAEGHYYLGESYSKLFLSSKAEAAYRESLRLMPDFRPAQQKLAMLLYERGAYREAISLLETMDRQQPNDTLVQGELAINYLALGEPRKAIPLLEAFNAARGRQAWGYAQLGRAYDLADDTDKAEELYRDALSMDEYFAMAHHWLGLLLARTDRAEEAEASLARYDQLRKLQTSEHDLQMRLLQGRDDVASLAKLADVRFQLGKREAAKQTLQRAERLAPGDERLKALRKKWLK